MRKTNTGYSISVFVGDGEVAAALRRGIDRFFVVLEEQRHPDRCQKILKEVDNNVKRVKESTCVKETH